MKRSAVSVGIMLASGLGAFSILALLWLLGNASLPVAAQGPDSIGTYYVAPGGHCGGVTPCYGTVQAAVDAADDPSDVIKVAAGTYTGVQGRPAPDGYEGPTVVTQMVYIRKTVTIQGGYSTANWTTPCPATQHTILDAQGQGRVLFVAGHKGVLSTTYISPWIHGLRITGGNADGLEGVWWGHDGGGGVYLLHATATIDSDLVFSNTAEFGGGLFLYDSNATLSGNTVSGNVATGSGWRNGGGGLYLDTSNATLEGNTIRDNAAAEHGGGLYLYQSDAALTENTVVSDTAAESGGGLYLDNSAATLSANDILSNTASGDGGGLYLYQSDTTLSNNTISDNVASVRGGGVCLGESDGAVLSGNEVSGNSANGTGHLHGGGGLHLTNSDAMLSGNVVSLNRANWGGGVVLEWSHATLVANVVLANTADAVGGGVAMYYADNAVLTGNTVSVNTASLSGGGLYLAWSNATLTRNVVISNVANGAGWNEGGGGIYSNASPTLQNNTIISNVADYGGGLYVTGSGATLDGNVVASNRASYGGGLRIYEADTTLVNNMVVDNRANSVGSGLHIDRSSAHLIHTTIACNSGGDGSGVYATSPVLGHSPTTVNLRNTILVSHSVGITVTVGNTAIVEATLWGDGAWANEMDWGGEGTILTGPSAYNRWNDPGFVDPQRGDYHICSTSDAVDHGIDAGVTTDIDGQPRPLASGYDLGADEFAYATYLPLVLRQYP